MVSHWYFFYGLHKSIFWQILDFVAWILLRGLALGFVHGLRRQLASVIGGFRHVNREIDSGGHGRICCAQRPTTEKLVAFDH